MMCQLWNTPSDSLMVIKYLFEFDSSELGFLFCPFYIFMLYSHKQLPQIAYNASSNAYIYDIVAIRMFPGCTHMLTGGKILKAILTVHQEKWGSGKQNCLLTFFRFLSSKMKGYTLKLSSSNYY